MAQDASGASPSITDPLPQQQGFNANEFLRKYWWEVALVVAVIAFLAYTYFNNSKAQVGNATTTAAGPNDAASSDGMSQAGNDANLVGMFSTQYQDMANAIAKLTSAENGTGAAAQGNCPPGSHWVPPSGPGPGSSAKFASMSGRCVSDNATGDNSSASAGKIGPRWYGPKSKFSAHVKEYAKLHPGAPAPVYGGMGGVMGHGGPPAFGPNVPFGTHIGLHAPLTSSGDMYATAR